MGQKRTTGPRTTGYSPKLAVYYLTLPLSHLTILKTEADLFGVNRSEFLVMLLRRKRSELSFQRPATAPKYKFSPKELREVDRYGWYLRHEDRKKVEEDRLSMGNLPPASWVIMLLNDWIDQARGLDTKP